MGTYLKIVEKVIEICILFLALMFKPEPTRSLSTAFPTLCSIDVAYM